jgi:hypothetical protein
MDDTGHSGFGGACTSCELDSQSNQRRYSSKEAGILTLDIKQERSEEKRRKNRLESIQQNGQFRIGRVHTHVCQYNGSEDKDNRKAKRQEYQRHKNGNGNPMSQCCDKIVRVACDSGNDENTKDGQEQGKDSSNLKGPIERCHGAFQIFGYYLQVFYIGYRLGQFIVQFRL